MESNDWYGLPENEEEQPNTSNEARKFQEITTHLPFQNLSSSETLLKKKLKVAVPKLPYTRAVGLLGGSPMWNRGAKRLPSGATNLSNTPKSNLVNVKTPVDGESSTKVESHINKSSLLAKRSQLKKNSVPSTSKTNLIAQEYNESEVSGFQKQTKLRLRSNKNNLHATENNQVDDIVVIDSSPDEKIRIMDYEDDNDKNIVAAEVSLSSVAQNVADSDDIPVIEMSTEFGIVASPMESEEPGEYMLFSSDVVDYVATTSPGDNNLDNGGILSSSDDDDMDESISEIVNMNDENNFEVLNHPNNDDHPYLMPEDDGMSTGSEVMIVEPNNDKSDLNKQSNSEHNTFNVIPSEIRRDTVLSNVVTVNCANDETKTVQSMVTKSVATTSTAALLVKPTVVPYGHLPISAAMIASKSGVSFTQTKPNTIVTTGHKKLETQTTAKVSIGNTTISVPVLKNVQMANQSKGGEPLNKNIKLSPTTFSLNLANKSTVINVGGHKINTKNLNNVRIVQALRQRGQQQNKLEQLSTETAIERLKAMSKSPALTYKNLSSLTVTQDTALPNKIFDDESPDSSIEHDDHNDLISPTPEQQDLNCSTTSDTATKQLPSSSSSDNKVMVPDTKEKDSAGDDLDNMMENITGESNKSAPQTIDTMAVTDDLVSTLSDNSQDSPQQELSKQQMQQKKQASAMPVHIVIKSTESSLSSQPKSITSHLPQLSPLSQPNELTTNLANASQQLRSIMSSIHQPSSVKTTTITTTTETIYPNESKILDVNKDLKSITNQHQSALIVTSHPTITVTTNPSITPAATGNLILLKQHPSVNVTMANRLNQVGLSKLKDEKNNQQLANENDNNQKVSTIVSILNSPQQPPQIQQSRLITVSSQSTQMSAPLSRPVVVSSSCGGIQVAHQTSLLNKSDSDTKPTMSILSAQLQQPLTKNTSTGGQQIHHTFTELSSQLSGLPFRRSKSTDETPEQAIRSSPAHIQATKRHNSCEVASIVKSEPLEQVPSSSGGTNTLSGGDSTNGGCRFSNVCAPPTFKADETQNVLLKQLLQNTSNCTIPSPSPPSQIAPTPRPNTSLRAPSLGVVNSLEDQLSRPVIPPAPANPSQQTTVGGQVNIQKTGNIAEQLKSRKLFNHETSFISKVQPMPPSPKEILSSSVSTSDDTKTSTASILSQSQTAIGSNDDNKLSLHPSVPPPPYSVAIKLTEPAITSTPNLTIKTELVTSQSVNQMITSAITTPTTVQDVIIKKELMDDNSQLSAASDQSAIKSETISQTGEYSADGSTPVTEATPKTGTETALELKRKKRREYQKSRRQMQLNKETGPSRKRSKKPAKLEEDYDTFIDTLMNQLRQMPPMQILEPLLSRNYGVCPSYGSGELSKIGPPKTATSNSKTDEFAGGFGSAEIPTVCDFYNTSPFGSKSPLLDTQSVSSTHYGFYDQEFSPIRFDTENDTNNHSHKYDYLTKDRDVETPDTIISSSSPECHAWESHSKSFPGLRLIQEESDDEMASITSRMSPSIPVLAPVPVRLTTGINLTADKSLGDIKNGELTIGKDSRFCPPSLLKEQSNMKVTLTLTSSAAEDIVGVLRDLANILHIPQPKTYEIIERTTTPPSQKLGLYRTRDKDGNEGAPIDIQTILNGEAKFCRHCDVVILNKMIKAKASEFPLLALNNNIEILNETDDLYFCSRSCYKQFKWRPTSILDDKTLDNTAKIGIDAGRFNRCDPSKELTVLTTTSLAVGDMSEDDLKMDMDQDTTILDDSSLGDTRLDTSTKSTVSSNVTLTGSDKESGTITPAKKPVRFMAYSQKAFASPVKYKRPTEKDTIEALFRMNITVTPGNRMPDDTRQCIFCHQLGDSVPDGASRLLNFDVDKWVHLNCALWSDGVYETVSGGLCNMEAALQASLAQPCTLCQNLGATIKCFKNRCANVYHLNCAQKDDCVFYKNKTVHCSIHAPKTEKDNELTTLCVQRRVYIERDESRQVAAIMHHSELSNLMRVGSLILLNVGQLLPHQLQAFHSPNYIYPIGYKIVRFFWSMRLANKRCRYICSIADVRGKPEFRVLIQEQNYDDLEVQDVSPKAVWQKILASLVKIRTSPELVKIFPQYISGEDLFGLTEPAIVRILESLPGIETLTDYHFKYGRNPLLELPLAINPSGAARTEPKQKQTMGWKKPHTQRTGSSSRPAFVPTNTIAGEVACPYSKQFVHSKSSQYKKMKQEWRNNVFLARSKIQGLGLYAARDLEKHTMVIEYIGEVIRTQLSELREKQYEARNRGIYMFRLDEERVVDATLSGGLARYINHSCNPNCVTEIVEVDREYRIIIFAKRRITRGEELSYDYKFDIEDDAHKIPCMCGAPNCRKWMN